MGVDGVGSLLGLGEHSSLVEARRGREAHFESFLVVDVVTVTMQFPLRIIQILDLKMFKQRRAQLQKGFAQALLHLFKDYAERDSSDFRVQCEALLNLRIRYL